MKKRPKWRPPEAAAQPADSVICRRSSSSSSKTTATDQEAIRQCELSCGGKMMFVIFSQLLLLLAASSLVLGAGDFQLAAPVGRPVRLPCLVGSRESCGEPYFIAWYKLNSSSRAWTRIEQLSSSELTVGRLEDSPPAAGRLSSSQSSGRPVNERVRLIWSRESAELCHSRSRANFHCAQLQLDQLEPTDEGQYKCEITFADSLDYENCPSNTISQLTVIAPPSEPEILVNGRPAAEANLSLKEGAQVRLECHSAGGRPAPRVEWLNLTRGQENLLQPISRSSYLLSRGVAGSSISVTVSRHELSSRFVCLVSGQQQQQQQQPQQLQPIELLQAAPPTASVRLAARQLADLVYQTPMLQVASVDNKFTGGATQQQQQHPQMLKWIKFDISVRPTSVSVRVLDLAAGVPLESRRPGAHTWAYSLAPRRFYAIQCLSESSRPKSAISWFNGSAPMELAGATLELLDSSDQSELQHLRAAVGARRSLAGRRLVGSFVRHLEQADGSFRTVASVILETKPSNLEEEEIFCRISNDAFSFDELTQVQVPIVSAKLQVNYPLTSWLELEDEDEDQGGGQDEEEEANGNGNGTGNQVDQPADRLIRRRTRRLGEQIKFGCFVGANPMDSKSVIQFAWFQDGKRLKLEPEKSGQDPASGRIAIESSRVAAGRGQVFASRVEIRSIGWSDGGQFECRFRLVDAAAAATGRRWDEQKLAWRRVGQLLELKVAGGGGANSAVAANAAPTLRLRASEPSILLEDPKPHTNSSGAEQSIWSVAIPLATRSIELQCQSAELPARVLWFVDGQLESAGPEVQLNVALVDELTRLKFVGRLISCAIESPVKLNSAGSQMSRNQIRLRFKVAANQIMADELSLMDAKQVAARGAKVEQNDGAKFACFAMCEPSSCQIEWLVNGNSIISQRKLVQGAESRLGVQFHWPKIAGGQIGANFKWLLFGRSAPSLGSDWFQVETQFELANWKRPSLGWSKLTSWTSDGLDVARLGEQAHWQLLKQQEERLRTSWPIAWSQLEFTPSKLARVSESQLEVECRLSSAFDQAARSLSLYPVRALAWMPPADEVELQQLRADASQLLRQVGSQTPLSSSVLSRIQLVRSKDSARRRLTIKLSPSKLATGADSGGELKLSEQQLGQILTEQTDESEQAKLSCQFDGPTTSPTNESAFRWYYTASDEQPLDPVSLGGGQQLNLRLAFSLLANSAKLQPASNKSDWISAISGSYSCSYGQLLDGHFASVDIVILAPQLKSSFGDLIQQQQQHQLAVQKETKSNANLLDLINPQNQSSQSSAIGLSWLRAPFNLRLDLTLVGAVSLGLLIWLLVFVGVQRRQHASSRAAKFQLIRAAQVGATSRPAAPLVAPLQPLDYARLQSIENNYDNLAPYYGPLRLPPPQPSNQLIYYSNCRPSVRPAGGVGVASSGGTSAATSSYTADLNSSAASSGGATDSTCADLEVATAAAAVAEAPLGPHEQLGLMMRTMRSSHEANKQQSRQFATAGRSEQPRPLVSGTQMHSRIRLDQQQQQQRQHQLYRPLARAQDEHIYDDVGLYADGRRL